MASPGGFHLLVLLALPMASKLAEMDSVTSNWTDSTEDDSEEFSDLEPELPLNSSDTEFTTALGSKTSMICETGLRGFMIKTVNNTLYNVRQYDPMPLGEFSYYYLTQGVLKGLSSLRNISELDVNCGKDSVTFSTKIRIDDPSVHFNWKRRIIFLFSGELWVNAEKLEVSLVVVMNENQRLNLKEARITKLDGFRFGFSGLGPLNPFITGAVYILEKIWNGIVVGKLEKIMNDVLRKEIAKIELVL